MQQKIDASLRIGINARYLNSPLSGIERYLVELMQHSNSAECEYVQRKISKRSIQTFSRYPLLGRLRPLYHALWDRYMEYFEGPLEEIDVFHAPSFIAPILKTHVPSVITVHDLAFLVHPEFFDRRTKAYYSLFLRPSLEAATKIICVSETTASDLLRFFPSYKSKVSVVYNGYKDFSCITPDDVVLPKLGLKTNSYLLCVGAFNARKNIESVLKITPRLKDRFPQMKLVVVGRMPEQYRCKLDKHLVFTGHVTDSELSALYRNASLFVYPSKYEGFGFPMLEAMSVGTPVAVSRASCLPEIGGLESANYFDPNCPDNIYKTLVCLLEKGREEVDLSSYKKSLQRFNWQRMSLETLEVYRQCLL